MSKRFKDQLSKKHKRKAEFSEKTDAWLDEKVNQPLAKKGFGKLGAGLSALGSTVGGFFDSEDNEIAQVAPSIMKGLRAKKVDVGEGIKKPKFKDLEHPEETRLAYDDISIPEKEARAAKLKKYDEEAFTLNYDAGEPKLRRPKKKR